jgi:hypothetical protein
MLEEMGKPAHESRFPGHCLIPQNRPASGAADPHKDGPDHFALLRQ